MCLLRLSPSHCIPILMWSVILYTSCMHISSLTRALTHVRTHLPRVSVPPIPLFHAPVPASQLARLHNRLHGCGTSRLGHSAHGEHHQHKVRNNCLSFCNKLLSNLFATLAAIKCYLYISTTCDSPRENCCYIFFLCVVSKIKIIILWCPTILPRVGER